jgi:Holliday junction DNA helicase RuvA
MIASIRGKLIATGTDHVVIETGGVGFLVFVPRTVLANLANGSDEVRLFTHLNVREDALVLYGFSTTDQRELFETLLTVSRIGPKVGLSLLSSATPDELRVAIASGDTARLARVPGIGKQTAERLVLELKNKVKAHGVALPANATPAQISANNELAEMLLALGFSAAEANAALAALPADAPADLEERLRLALRYFGTP